jgi:iron complex transport system substrate-binding protein
MPSTVRPAPSRPRLRRAALTFCALFAAGCGPSTTPRDARGADSRAPAAPPQRIAALTCAAVDILDALGALDRVVAVEEDCPAPGTEGKLKIRNDDLAGRRGAFNLESLLDVRPDAIVAKPDLRPALRDLPLRTLWAPTGGRYEDVEPFTLEVGALVGDVEGARRLLAAMRERERAIRASTAALPRTRVYFESAAAGSTSGARSVIDAMIRLAGGVSVAGGEDRAGTTVSAESVLAFDPEVIVLGPFAEPDAVVAARPGWSRLTAVRTGRIHRLPAEDRRVLLASPRCVDGCAKYLVPWLHPELVQATRR